jgi:N-acetylglutamate synthase-like GNAT family acetyltransferase
MIRPFQIRPLETSDKEWVSALLSEHWGSARIVTRGKIRQADELPGFIAVQGKKRAGLVTYHIEGKGCEVTSMNSLVEGIGIGSALVEAVKNSAAAAGCRRLWLITTNDNSPALRFWQKRGFRLSALYPDAIKKSRLLKPEIPLTGNDGIPIRDEIELEMTPQPPNASSAVAGPP